MTFFLTMVFVLMVFWRPQEWLIPWLFGWPLLDGVVFTALLALLLEAKSELIRFAVPAWQMALLAMILLAALMSHVVHTYFAGLIYTAEELSKLLFFSLLLLVVLDRPERLRTIAVIFVLMACTMAWHAMLQQRRGYGFAWQPPMWQPATAARPACLRSLFFGIFSDPNDLAQILVTAMPFCFAIPKRMHALSFAVAAGLATFLYLAFLGTHSRGGMIGLVATGAVLALIFFPARWMPWLIGLGLLGGLVMCASGVLLDMSSRERVVFWGFGNWAFKRSPLFGIGYEMFWSVGAGRAAHNAFVTCYTEVGLFGYYPWFTLMVLGFVGAWRGRMALKGVRHPATAYMRRYVLLTIAAFGGFAASSYFLSRAFVYPMFFMIAILSATVMVVQRMLPATAPALIKPRRDLALWGGLGSIASIMYIYISIVLLNRAVGG